MSASKSWNDKRAPLFPSEVRNQNLETFLAGDPEIWFAWYPVKSAENKPQLIWLRKVWRAPYAVFSGAKLTGFIWIYRTKIEDKYKDTVK